MLDTWAEEELKIGTLSNGTVGTYLQAINRIKQHPVSRRKLKTVTSGHLQQFMDIMSFGGTIGDFGNALADILKKARKQQLKNRMQYGELYYRDFYSEVTEKNRVHCEYYNSGMAENAVEGNDAVASMTDTNVAMA